MMTSNKPTKNKNKTTNVILISLNVGLNRILSLKILNIKIKVQSNQWFKLILIVIIFKEKKN